MVEFGIVKILRQMVNSSLGAKVALFVFVVALGTLRSACGNPLSKNEAQQVLARLTKQSSKWLTGHFLLIRTAGVRLGISRQEIWTTRVLAHVKNGRPGGEQTDQYYDPFGQYNLSRDILEADPRANVYDGLGLNVFKAPGRDLLTLDKIEVSQTPTGYEIDGWRFNVIQVKALLNQDLAMLSETDTLLRDNVASTRELKFGDLKTVGGLTFPSKLNTTYETSDKIAESLQVISFSTPALGDLKPNLSSPHLRIDDARGGNFVRWTGAQLRSRLPKSRPLDTALLLTLSQEELKRHPINKSLAGKKLLEGALNAPEVGPKPGQIVGWISGAVTLMVIFVWSAINVLKTKKISDNG